jgi:hypothetical protein
MADEDTDETPRTSEDAPFPDLSAAVAGSQVVVSIINVAEAFDLAAELDPGEPTGDPLDELDDDERAHLNEGLRDIVRSQKEAETLSGGRR